MQLTEQYRPSSFEELIGQEKAVSKVQALAKRGLAGRAYWISGPSGVGKTSLARIIANTLAESWNIEEIDAQDCTLDFVRDMERGFSLMGMGAKTGKVWIINEAHGLRGAVLSRFLTAMEAITPHCCIIFTTTNDGEDSLFEDFDTPPFLSRCTRLKLSSRGIAEPLARRAQEIAEREGLGGRDFSWYLERIRQGRNNMRGLLNEIEAGEAIAA